MVTISRPAFLKQIWLTLGASLSFLVVGLVLGYSSTAIPSIEMYDPHLIQSSEQKSWIGAIPSLGAFLGSVLSGVLMERLGRRRTLLVAAPLWAAGWLLLGLAPNLASVLAGRIISGFCVGLVMACAQVYVSECCDAEVRGLLGSLPTLCMNGGILLTYVMGNWMYWRHIAYASSGISVLFLLGLLPLPESPVWLSARGKDPQPSLEWLHLRAPPSVPTNMKPITSINTEIGTLAAPPPSLFTREVFFSSPVIKPLVIGFTLLTFQQVTGIDAIISFTVEIFKSSGSTLNASTATIIVGAVQLVFSGLSTLMVDAAGRRPLLLASSAIMTVSLASMGIAFYYEYKHMPWLDYLPLVSLIVFIIGFSLGFCGLPLVLLGELFPAQYRSQLSAMAGSVNLLSMFVVIKSYHPLEDTLTSAGTFWLYSCCCGLGFLFVLLFVPETKRKTLDEIENLFKSKKHDNAAADVKNIPLEATTF